MKNSVLKPLRDAGRGFCLACRGRNMRIELMATAWALLLVWTAGYGRWYYIAVALASGLVIGTECLNTSIEKLCDRVTTEREDAIRDIKDIAAGAVIATSVVAVVTALFLFVDLDFWRAVLTAIGDDKGWTAAALVVLPAGAVITLLPPRKKDVDED